ncbi:MAG: hypothetical protein AAF802_21035 [Planctomycetota bacterium]
MEVKRQTCQTCNSIDLRNILVRDGHDQVVFVRCAQCKALVARYVLKDYYHHGKGIESYLRAHKLTTGDDSGRAWLEAFEASQRTAEVGYQEALDALQSQNKEV